MSNEPPLGPSFGQGMPERPEDRPPFPSPPGEHGQVGAAPAPKKKKTGMIIAIVAGAVALLCIIGVVIFVLTGQEETKPKVVKGDCIPKMNNVDQDFEPDKVACGPGAMRVVARFDDTLDLNKCDAVKSAREAYGYKVDGGYVLCVQPV